MKVGLTCFAVLKGENVLLKAGEWSPLVRVSGEIPSVLGHLLTFPLFGVVVMAHNSSKQKGQHKAGRTGLKEAVLLGRNDS